MESSAEADGAVGSGPPDPDSAAALAARPPRKRSLASWLATAVAVGLLLLLSGVLIFGTFPVPPPATAPHSAGSPPGSGGGGDGGVQVLVKNGTDWSIPSHAFEARWFSVGEESELEGSYSSIGAVRIYLLNSTGFVSYVGGNFTTGSLPANSSPTESQIAWSSGTTTGGGYVDTFAGGQNYDLLVCAEDGGSSVHFEFTSAFVASVADVA